jgi:Proteasome subunit
MTVLTAPLQTKLIDWTSFASTDFVCLYPIQSLHCEAATAMFLIHIYTKYNVCCSLHHRLSSDVRSLVNVARELCTHHRWQWKTPILPAQLARLLADHMHSLTRAGDKRPCAADVLLVTASNGSNGSTDDAQPCVYQIQVR